MLYVLLLVFGFIGLFIMAAMGSLRTGRGHPGARGHSAKGHGKGVHRGKVHVQGKSNFGLASLLQAFSPIDFFATAMGAGALGIVGRKVFKNEQIALGMAVAGGIIMDFLIVKPLLNLMMKYASDPSEGLEGAVSQLAEAATSFDGQGRGLIKLTIDGQTSQILATLEPGEVGAGIRVSKGDRLVILDVDSARNICRVSREIAIDE
ncbi:MAG: hypothetical protein ABL949_05405 [Fimbriimonadaceae bacterium]